MGGGKGKKKSSSQNEELIFFFQKLKYDTDQLKTKSTASFAKWTDTGTNNQRWYKTNMMHWINAKCVKRNRTLEKT